MYPSESGVEDCALMKAARRKDRTRTAEKESFVIVKDCERLQDRLKRENAFLEKTVDVRSSGHE